MFSKVTGSVEEQETFEKWLDIMASPILSEKQAAAERRKESLTRLQNVRK